MSNKIRVHVLHTGKVIVDEALPFYNEKNNKLAWTGLFRGKKHKVAVPVSAYLIEHPKGLILIDTGWHTDNRKNQLKNLRHQYPVNKAYLPEGEAINEQLMKLGYKTSDLDYVLLSHLHCDHADGLRLVKDAKHILVSEEEWEVANKDRIKYLQHEWHGVDVKTFKLKNSGGGPFNKSFDLFNDGSIEMIFTPGHSKGLCVTIVRSYESEKYIILASDTGYAAKSFEENILPGITEDKVKTQKSLDWVRSHLNDDNCLEIIANHDSGVEEHIIEL